MKRFSFTFMIAAALAVASCSEQKPETAAQPVAISGLVTETLQAMNLADVHEVPGAVRSKTSTAIAARISGYITAVAVDEGDRVRPGQVVVEIDSRDVALQERRAEAGETEAREALAEIDGAIRAAELARNSAITNRDLAASTLARYRELRDRRSVTPQEFDEVQARHAVSEAEVGRAAESLEALRAKRRQVLARIDQAQTERAAAALQRQYTQVLAPAGGIVTERHAEPGMLAAPGMPLLLTEDDTRYQLEVPVEESRLSAIRRGSPVRIRIEGAGLDDLPARVSEILPAADPASRTVMVRIDLPRSSSLRSGLFGRASFTLGERQAVTVPLSAIVRQGQLDGVWTVENGIVRYRLLRLGKQTGDRVEVLSGASAGDTVVLSPPGKLSDGMEVRP
jgi:multidrug efflux pump subunit AcrA (membrane-fusion protein)